MCPALARLNVNEVELCVCTAGEGPEPHPHHFPAPDIPGAVGSGSLSPVPVSDYKVDKCSLRHVQ